MKTNGVNVDELKNTCQVIQNDPDIAKTQFRIKNEWASGGNNRITVSNFYGAKKEQTRKKEFHLEADEPPLLLGDDKGANPVEYLLTALSSCMTTAIIYHAAAKGIAIKSLRSEFTGDLDLRGFLDLSKDVPKGFQTIDATFWVQTDADLKQFESLYQFSPVYSMVSKAVPIQVKFYADK